VTGIELGLTSNSAIYTVNIIGNGFIGTVVPAGGCNDMSGFKHTLTVGPNERVTKIDAWLKNTDDLWYRLTLTLSSGTTQEYNAMPTGSSSSLYKLYTFQIPTGYEFTGIYAGGVSSLCEIRRFLAVYRTCSISIDLSAIDGKSQNVLTDPAKSITFTATPDFACGAASIEYQVTYSPSSTTSNLITLPTSTTASITFAQTKNLADAKSYTVTVRAGPAGISDWLSSATATYSYIDQCLATSLVLSTLTPMNNSVLKQTLPGGTPFYETQTVIATDSVS
jgi:hypothetical protein